MGEAAPEASEPEGAVRGKRAAQHDIGKQFVPFPPDLGAFPGFWIVTDNSLAVGAAPEDSGVVFQNRCDIIKRCLGKGVLPIMNETQPALVSTEPHDAVIVTVQALDAFTQEGSVR